MKITHIRTLPYNANRDKALYKCSILLLLYVIYAGGHLGRDKSLAKVQARYYWPNMVRDIIGFLKACDRCQRVNQKEKGVAKPPPIPVPVGFPWDKVLLFSLFSLFCIMIIIMVIITMIITQFIIYILLLSHRLA